MQGVNFSVIAFRFFAKESVKESIYVRFHEIRESNAFEEQTLERWLVAVFSSIHSTFEIVTNMVISDELPFGTHISMRFILSENKATIDIASKI